MLSDDMYSRYFIEKSYSRLSYVKLAIDRLFYTKSGTISSFTRDKSSFFLNFTKKNTGSSDNTTFFRFSIRNQTSF